VHPSDSLWPPFWPSSRKYTIAPAAGPVDIYGSFRSLRTEIICTPIAGDPFEVDMLAGSISNDSGSFRRRTAPLLLRVSAAEAKVLNTPGTLLQIRHGHRDGNTDVLHPVFCGEPITALRDLGDGQISLTAADLAVWLDRARFVSPYTAPTGVSRVATIGNLVTDARPGTTVANRSSSSSTVAALAVWDDNRVDAIRDLATDANVEVFFAPDGTFVIRDPQSLSSTPVWTVRPGDGGTLKSASRQMPLDRLYNTVVVRPSATDGSQTWTQQIVQVTDPDHPRHPSKIGVVPYFWASPTITSAAGALSAGRTILNRVLGTAETLSLELIGNPTLESGDVIRVVTPTINDETGDIVTHFIDSYTLDLVTGSMSMKTRSANA